MSDKQENIEDFVRKVVDQSEAQIPFNESHWAQMESMLDAQLPVVTNPGNGYYYFSNVVSLLVGLVFVWTWFIGNSKENSVAIQTAKEEVHSAEVESSTNVTQDLNPDEQIQVVAATEMPSEKVSDVDQSSPLAENQSEHTATVLSTNTEEKDQWKVVLTENETETNTTDQQRIASRTLTITTPISTEASNIKATSSTASNADKSVIDRQEDRGVTRNESQSVPTSKSANNDDQAVAEPLAVLLDRDEEANDDYELLPRIGIDLNGDLPEFPDQLEYIEIDVADGGANESDSSPIVRRSVRSSYSRLSIGISLAPDLSSNEIFRYNRLGRDLGIVVDYWVTPRLSVSLGAFNTSKRYLVGGEEYSPPAGFWGNVTNGERPAKIDADCQVLDIPINLKYQLVNRPKLNIYASAGVSSYIMLQEDYQYELESGWKSEWGISNANQHFFGVGNLQVHFERRFGKHLAVEVAPFFKVPLTSYGHGNIRFHSMGSFFTVRKYLLNR